MGKSKQEIKTMSGSIKSSKEEVSTLATFEDERMKILMGIRFLSLLLTKSKPGKINDNALERKWSCKQEGSPKKK